MLFKIQPSHDYFNFEDEKKTSKLQRGVAARTVSKFLKDLKDKELSKN
jgi:hypothetical protein